MIENMENNGKDLIGKTMKNIFTFWDVQFINFSFEKELKDVYFFEILPLFLNQCGSGITIWGRPMGHRHQVCQINYSIEYSAFYLGRWRQNIKDPLSQPSTQEPYKASVIGEAQGGQCQTPLFSCFVWLGPKILVIT